MRHVNDGRVMFLSRFDMSLVIGDAVMSKTVRLG